MRAVIEFQLELGVSHVILPAPLITEREDEAQTLADWIDLSLEASADLDVGQPILASVPVLDSVAVEASSASVAFIETLVDQVSSRDGLSGVYIPVVQTPARHPFEIDANVLRSVVHLTRAFARSKYSLVLPNFVDVFGLVCMAFGASGLITGSSQSLRRLSLQSLEDSSGGVALPHYYSHVALSEFLTEADLTPVARQRLLRRIEDRSPYSENLLEALQDGRSASQLPDWVESRNNYARAHIHFVWRIQQEATALARLPISRRQEVVRNWLEDADANVLYLRDRVPGRIEGHVAPARQWLNLFDQLIDELF